MEGTGRRCSPAPRPTPGAVQRRRALAIAAAVAATGADLPARDPRRRRAATRRAGAAPPGARSPSRSRELVERADARGEGRPGPAARLRGHRRAPARSSRSSRPASSAASWSTRRNWLDAAQGAALVGALRGRAACAATDPAADRDRAGGRRVPLARRPAARRAPARHRRQRRSRGSPSAGPRDGAGAARAGFDLNLGLGRRRRRRSTARSPTAPSPTTRSIAAEMTAAAVRGCARGADRLRRPPLPRPRRRLAGHRRGAGDRQPRPGDARRPATSPPSRPRSPRACPAVVLSHAFYAAYDPVTPASLARPVAAGLLRDELGFTRRRDHRRPRHRRGQGDDAGVPTPRSRRCTPAPTWSRSPRPGDQEGVAEALARGRSRRRDPRGPARRGGGRVLELKRTLNLLRL